MITLLIAAALAAPTDLMAAAEAELERAMTLRLPDQPAPYYVSMEILDGSMSTALANFGAVTSHNTDRYRNLRVDVRVGSAMLDNTNFSPSFGERSGMSSRGLPDEDDPLALRREMWLALDTAYKGATEQLAAKLSAFEGRDPSAIPDLSQAPALRTGPIDPPTIDDEITAEIVTALTTRLGQTPGLEDASAIARDWQGVRMMCSSEGTRAWVPSGFTVVRIEGIIRSEDGGRIRDSRSWVARDVASLPPLDEMLAEVDELGTWLTALRDAPIEEDYLGPVLLEAPAAVEMFRQLLLPEIVGTPPQAEPPNPYQDFPSGAASARPGRRLLPQGWSVTDDPGGLPGAAGHFTHDYEGVAAERVELVVDGVARDLLMSRIPRKGFLVSNGHGRSLGLDRRSGLPGVIAVTPKRSRSQRRLERRALTLARQAGLDYVLVIGMIEPPALTEDFRVAFSGEGPLPGITRPLQAWRLYPDGTTQPVRGLEFVGVDRRAMRDVAVAGPMSAPMNLMDATPDSNRYSIGSVGGLPSTWSAPSVVITELELRGSGGGERRLLAPPVAED
ncbi:MAG: TldD protein [Myxococcota bacterium]